MEISTGMADPSVFFELRLAQAHAAVERFLRTSRQGASHGTAGDLELPVVLFRSVGAAPESRPAGAIFAVRVPMNWASPFTTLYPSRLNLAGSFLSAKILYKACSS